MKLHVMYGTHFTIKKLKKTFERNSIQVYNVFIGAITCCNIELSRSEYFNLKQSECFNILYIT